MVRHRVIALSGGVGGAKLAWGLTRVLTPDDLLIVANTGDDFEHLGLHISPDIDTLIYTLSGLADLARGWGRDNETWNFMSAMGGLGGETWFQLGDRDLAMHIERTRRLRSGEALSQVTIDLASRVGVRHRILPMCDEPVRTMLETDVGLLAFQDYFVRQQCRPSVQHIEYRGAESAYANKLHEALADPALLAVVLCPSNPFLSIGPILALPAVRRALVACVAPVIAISPIVAGKAIKGPTAQIMRTLGHSATALGVAELYADFLDGFVVDEEDASEATTIQERLQLPCRVADTIMVTPEHKMALADAALRFGRELSALTSTSL